MVYNLTMHEAKHGNTDFIHLTDGMLCSLASAPDGVYSGCAKTWQKQIARIKNVDLTYRSLNYLSSIGLFTEKRDEDGRGWRGLSFVECIYLDLVSELRRFNVKATTLQAVYKAFSQEVEPSKAAVLQSVWLDALILIHCLSTEVYLFIDADGKVDFCDAGSAFFYAHISNTGSAIVIPLSSIVNKFRLRNNLKTVTIEHDMFDTGLKSSELDMVMEIRNLDENERVEYVKKKKGGLIVSSKPIEKDKLDIFSSMVDEDFGSITINKENGKVVQARKEKRNLVIDD